jgi:hypothetical protein
VTQCHHGAPTGVTVCDADFGLLALGFEDVVWHFGLGTGVCDCDSLYGWEAGINLLFFSSPFHFFHFNAGRFDILKKTSERASRWKTFLSSCILYFSSSFCFFVFGFCRAHHDWHWERGEIFNRYEIRCNDSLAIFSNTITIMKYEYAVG